MRERESRGYVDCFIYLYIVSQAHLNTKIHCKQLLPEVTVNVMADFNTGALNVLSLLIHTK